MNIIKFSLQIVKSRAAKNATAEYKQCFAPFELAFTVQKPQLHTSLKKCGAIFPLFAPEH